MKTISQDMILPNLNLISEAGANYIREIAQQSEKAYNQLKVETVSFGHSQREAIDIFCPNHITQALPVFIFMHGGYWANGAREMMGYMAQQMVTSASPMIFVSVGYRLSPEHKFPIALQDCANAIKKVYAVIENYGGDKHQLIISGHSAGGNMATLLVLEKDWLRPIPEADIKLCAPLSGVFDLHDIPIHLKTAYIAQEEDYIRASPIHCKLEHNTVPFLLTIGDNDFENVKRSHALMCAKMYYENQTFESLIVEKESHLSLPLNVAEQHHPWMQTVKRYLSLQYGKANCHLI